MRNLNCWEIKKCGREPGGSKSGELGVCPTAADTSSDGINGGINGGRLCWGSAVTHCCGKVQGRSSQIHVFCMSCEIFNTVKTEEGPEFVSVKSGRICQVLSQ